ncbi:hypothetical protein PACTADRAFT_52153 [Pachysolen tannophilus NRRL Y-2460]|uniref:Uncharacterized protein n=1 Tax=Pachysolen tannophilus NRRL Y-2460 TaxID=669874 RepID=A0A1E4TMX7_PACTA|nr:hypothetical protein PACTADRAFT_52153 [Pachysolen tannophilus NRRL Y-2460]
MNYLLSPNKFPFNKWTNNVMDNEEIESDSTAVLKKIKEQTSSARENLQGVELDDTDQSINLILKDAGLNPRMTNNNHKKDYRFRDYFDSGAAPKQRADGELEDSKKRRENFLAKLKEKENQLLHNNNNNNNNRSFLFPSSAGSDGLDVLDTVSRKHMPEKKRQTQKRLEEELKFCNHKEQALRRERLEMEQKRIQEEVERNLFRKQQLELEKLKEEADRKERENFELEKRLKSQQEPNINLYSNKENKENIEKIENDTMELLSKNQNNEDNFKERNQIQDETYLIEIQNLKKEIFELQIENKSLTHKNENLLTKLNNISDNLQSLILKNEKLIEDNKIKSEKLEEVLIENEKFFKYIENNSKKFIEDLSLNNTSSTIDTTNVQYSKRSLEDIFTVDLKDKTENGGSKIAFDTNDTTQLLMYGSDKIHF